MCGRVVYVWDAKTGRLVRKVDERALDDPGRAHVLKQDRYNVPPASHLPVIDGRPVRRGEPPRITVARWGFPVPRRPNGVFNTSIETAPTSPLWRGMLGRHHCVFFVRGFYEWGRGRVRTPHFIHRSDGQPMLLAGLIEHRVLGGVEEACASIVTCPPDAFMGAMHDRMPVVLEEKDMEAWLAADVEGSMRLAVPTGHVLAGHQVTADVGDTKNDGPHLIEPVGQQRLGGVS